MANVLIVKNLSIQFRGLAAVSGYALSLEKGAIFGLIGTNGAGKTTVFNMLTGALVPDSGTIAFEGKDITGHRPDRIAKRGIARTFQNLRLFSGISVLDNVLVGAQLYKHYGYFQGILGLPAARKDEAALREKALELLEIMGLADFASREAGSLPYGSQRRLEIARALATRPKLLLLDEPAAGMNPKESLELMETISRIRERFGVTVLLIEHDMKVVMNLCERVQVLCYGKIIAEGTPTEIKNDPQVVEAYLGRSVRHA
jgi:branched-chain amino acid transport system ATP-binding protein